jgi:hypothetical protein
MSHITRRLFILGAATAVLPAGAKETAAIDVTAFVQEIVRGYRSPRTPDDKYNDDFINLMLPTVPRQAPVPDEVKARLAIFVMTAEMAFVIPALVEEQTPQTAKKHNPDDRLVAGILSDLRKEAVLFAEYLTFASDLSISRTTDNGKARFYTIAEIVERANEELTAALQDRPEQPPRPPCDPPRCMPG